MSSKKQVLDRRLLSAAFMAVEQGSPAGRERTGNPCIDGHGRRGSLARPAGRRRAHKDGDEDDGGPAMMYTTVCLSTYCAVYARNARAPQSLPNHAIS